MCDSPRVLVTIEPNGLALVACTACRGVFIDCRADLSATCASLAGTT
jgi:hypothetical protein